MDDEPERVAERRFHTHLARSEEEEEEGMEEEMREEADHLAPLPSQLSMKKKSGVKKRKLPRAAGKNETPI